MNCEYCEAARIADMGWTNGCPGCESRASAKVLTFDKWLKFQGISAVSPEAFYAELAWHHVRRHEELPKK